MVPASDSVPFPLRSAHLIGVGGSGMFPLAQALVAEGVRVSGSDVSADKQPALEKLGVHFSQKHAAGNITQQDCVVVSSAIGWNNPELAAARELGIPVIHRSVMLGWFLARKCSILVAGTHGKTTTTAMLSLLLEAADLDPWSFVGGKVREFGGNMRRGSSDLAVAEADESDGSFLNLPRRHLLLLNLEPEHMNHWHTEEALIRGFKDLVGGMEAGGKLVANGVDGRLRRVLQETGKPHVTYGPACSGAFDYNFGNVQLGGNGSRFDLFRRQELLGRFAIGVPGEHNVSNLTGALAMAAELGAGVRRLEQSLKEFRGVDRRFTIYPAESGYLVIDDYAHHPTEISATVQAARRLADERRGRLLVVFQPHRYSRMKECFHCFGSCFSGADELLAMEVYSGGEEPIPGISGEELAKVLAREYPFPVEFAPSLEAIKKGVGTRVKVDDIVLLLGAGSVTRLTTLLTDPVENHRCC